ncbi:MAG: YccF domain-containing protein [Ilumatobacteraceae bacterium]
MSSLPPPPPGQYVETRAPGGTPGAGSLLLNLLWLFLSGIWLCIGYLTAGIAMCVTIIGIPFGIQSFKLGLYALWPFGRSVVYRQSASGCLSIVGNVLWLILAGFWLAVGHAILGLLLCITVVGIPLGIGNFKLVPLALLPFGKDVVPNGGVTGRVYVSF